MRPEAIHQAKERLKRAEAAYARLVNSRNLDAIESAWSDFLFAASGIYSKLEKGSKGHGPSEGWFGRMKRYRKDDALLSYVHHARNAEEHGIAAITQREAGFLGVSGDVVMSGTLGPGGKLTVTGIPGGRPPAITVKDPRVKLIAVTDDRYGDVFEVPTTHLGLPLDDPSPDRVAGMALTYLRTLIADGAKFIPPPRH